MSPHALSLKATSHVTFTTAMSAPTTSLPSTLGFQPEGNTRPQSLLSQTLDTLDYDTRSTLESRSGNSFLAVADTLHLARRKRELCIRTRQKVKRVIIRDVVERIIHWLEKFQNLSAAADRYDSRSASFAWASVGHLLNVCRLHSEWLRDADNYRRPRAPRIHM